MWDGNIGHRFDWQFIPIWTKQTGDKGKPKFWRKHLNTNALITVTSLLKKYVSVAMIQANILGELSPKLQLILLQSLKILKAPCMGTSERIKNLSFYRKFYLFSKLFKLIFLNSFLKLHGSVVQLSGIQRNCVRPQYTNPTHYNFSTSTSIALKTIQELRNKMWRFGLTIITSVIELKTILSSRSNVTAHKWLEACSNLTVSTNLIWRQGQL